MTEPRPYTQVDLLTEWITGNVPGAPFLTDEGPVAAAISIMTDQQQAIGDLADAIRLTVEYLGLDVLPAQPGWSWYDALAKHAPELLNSMRASMPGRIEVGPHDFQPLSWITSRLRHRGKCARCYLARDDHPVSGYVPARPLGDTSPLRKGRDHS
jgi:hypothetical protein